MNNKHKTGDYLIYLFDQYGTKQDTKTADYCVKAKELGDEMIKNPPYASYTIVRVIANSLDNFNPWSSL